MGRPGLNPGRSGWDVRKGLKGSDGLWTRFCPRMEFPYSLRETPLKVNENPLFRLNGRFGIFRGGPDPALETRAILAMLRATERGKDLAACFVSVSSAVRCCGACGHQPRLRLAADLLLDPAPGIFAGGDGPAEARPGFHHALHGHRPGGGKAGRCADVYGSPFRQAPGHPRQDPATDAERREPGMPQGRLQADVCGLPRQGLLQARQPEERQPGDGRIV
jgi:hypothetical protein